MAGWVTSVLVDPYPRFLELLAFLSFFFYTNLPPDSLTACQSEIKSLKIDFTFRSDVEIK